MVQQKECSCQSDLENQKDSSSLDANSVVLERAINLYDAAIAFILGFVCTAIILYTTALIFDIGLQYWTGGELSLFMSAKALPYEPTAAVDRADHGLLTNSHGIIYGQIFRKCLGRLFGSK